MSYKHNPWSPNLSLLNCIRSNEFLAKQVCPQNFFPLHNLEAWRLMIRLKSRKAICAEEWKKWTCSHTRCDEKVSFQWKLSFVQNIEWNEKTRLDWLLINRSLVCEHIMVHFIVMQPNVALLIHGLHGVRNYGPRMHVALFFMVNALTEIRFDLVLGI